MRFTKVFIKLFTNEKIEMKIIILILTNSNSIPSQKDRKLLKS